MAYHRSGHPGAVAVSFSTNTMPPLSPSQRYSSTTSTTTTSGISTTTTKFNTFRSPMTTLERNYTSPTAASTYRSRRIQCSPARSVCTFSEPSSVVSSSIPKYSSTCNSSASSTVSSSSSSNRDRTTTPAADLTAEEFYQKYSPTNYVPNIHNNRETTPTPPLSITLNGHCKKSYPSSGTSHFAELHGGDESIYGDRRTGILTKRRIPTISGALFGNDEIDSITTTSPNEVTNSQQQQQQQQQHLHQCNESSENHNGFNPSDSNANNNQHNNEFNVNFNDVKLIDNNDKLHDTSSISSTLSSPIDIRWCESDSSPISDSINYLSTTNNITISEKAWKDNTNIDNNFLTNNNEQECNEHLNETDDDDDRERLSKGKWLIGNDIEGIDESQGGIDNAGAIGLNSYRAIDENGFRVTSRPSGSQGDDSSQPSTSRRTTIFWGGDTLGDDISATTAATAAAAGGGVPVGVHQTIYRGLTDQIEDSSNARPARSRLTGRRDESYGLNGLRNIGNTCFMNSVIQCLSNTRPLLEYLLNEHYLNDINTTTSSMKGALIKSFALVIHELWEGSGERVVNTTAFKSQIQRFAPRFMGYAQQDAQEFLRYLLEGLHEDVNRVTAKPQPILTDIPDHYTDSAKAAESWKRYLRSEDSTIVDVFVGQLRSSLTCTACDHVSVTLDPFWDLSLPIPVRTGTVRLAQCLEYFTKAETLDGDEKPTCSKCQMRRKCTKTFRIQKFPKILVIHLKRFSPTERFRAKLSVVVDFPLTGLDLSAFAAPGVQGCTYNLYGVANHSGTPYSGHYTAYCKHPYSGDWHEYNDSRVTTVSASSVISSEAYVLFYEQQPISPHL